MERMMVENFPQGIAVETGHDLFFPGLFVQSAGRNANLPIVRFGNIARMPGDELLTLESEIRRMQIRGYLAESHSWGGHSGSPVFWHYTYNINIPIEVRQYRSPLCIKAGRTPTRQANVMIGVGWAQGLLGLVSGHYDIPMNARDRNRNPTDFQLGVNAGIAIVTPAENIRELLMRQDVVENRQQRADEIEEPAATADSARLDNNEQLTLAPDPKDRIKIPILTREQFERDLKKATRKRDKK